MSDVEETVWQGKWIAAKRQGKWEYVSRARGIKAVVIVAIDGDHVLLVDQYRVPLGRRCIELPAGLIGDDHADDTVESAARRELEEETGYTCAEVENLGEYFASPGMITESLTLVRVHGLSRIGDGGGLSDEDIIVHRVPKAELRAFVAAKRAEGAAVDVKLLVLLAESLLGA